MEEHALPELEKMKPQVYNHVFETMKSQRIRGDKEFLKNYHRERSIEMVSKSFCSSVYQGSLIVP